MEKEQVYKSVSFKSLAFCPLTSPHFPPLFWLSSMFPVSDFNFVVAGIATFAATVGYACTRQLGASLYDIYYYRLMRCMVTNSAMLKIWTCLSTRCWLSRKGVRRAFVVDQFGQYNFSRSGHHYIESRVAEEENTWRWVRWGQREPSFSLVPSNFNN